ncbi:hypothetical protein CA13_35420 [Planctomycetes bacterium CA13]|uniref:Uncharacterized protein n=1 Tax=Novipirellula herctigrandis TaxID=2527986 RepID=A0A5C5Z3X9_9BACT|nr:hypothetical protein CA13_35420 [Planctomycetes bacterium CA13]
MWGGPDCNGSHDNVKKSGSLALVASKRVHVPALARHRRIFRLIYKFAFDEFCIVKAIDEFGVLKHFVMERSGGRNPFDL